MDTSINADTVMDQQPITAYKGFDRNLQCRGFQFELQQTYTHEGKVKACESGFHACEYPLATFGYYAPAESRYADVSLSGQMHSDGSDTKIAAASITINAELRIPELVKRAIAWITERCNPAKADHSTGYRSASSSKGDRRSASSATGDRSASSATGYLSASSATGYLSASSATGYRSAATNTGDYGSAEILDGERSSFGVAVATGHEGKARASLGSSIVLVHRDDDGAIVHIRAAVAGKEVKADTWYSLTPAGDFVEASP